MEKKETEKSSSELADERLTEMVSKSLAEGRHSKAMIEEIIERIEHRGHDTDAELVNDIMNIVGC